MIEVRAGQLDEVPALAWLWCDGWQDAHAEIVPQALARARTLESFTERMARGLLEVGAVGPRGAPLGFYMLKGDELYQFYVGAKARGRGVAQVLMADAEARLRKRGTKTAWLACAIGNDRAARFYEKAGWSRACTFLSRLETVEGLFHLEVWQYEKSL
jgi:GNAT superfamily N-acetyltransferase